MFTKNTQDILFYLMDAIEYAVVSTYVSSLRNAWKKRFIFGYSTFCLNHLLFQIDMVSWKCIDTLEYLEHDNL